MPRTVRTPQRRAAFLAALAKGVPIITEAAAAIGVGRQTMFDWKRDDPAFRNDWNEALDVAIEAVEGKLYERAMADDLLAMIFFLKSRRTRR
jgi:hypothetical protein